MENQKCQDEELTKKFQELHIKLVNEIVTFCKENNLEIDEFNLWADGVKESIVYGEWCPGTDSCFVFNEESFNERVRLGLGHKPFLSSY